MMISISRDGAMYAFCVPVTLLKVFACVLSMLFLFSGYCLVQLSAFILACTPGQFFRIVLFIAFLVVLFTIGFIGRFLLSKAGAK